MPIQTLARPSQNGQVMSVHDKYTAARKELERALIERDSEINLALVGLVAREHVLLIGVPGVGKSLLMDAIVNWVDGPTFSILFHRSLPVDEIMGAISVKALREQDIFERNTAGKLPEASVACLDEIFKCSPVGLTPTLRILNERVYERQGQWMKSPLHSALAGSNEWPPDDDPRIDMSALFDRFLLRKEVKPIRSRLGEERLLGIPVTGQPIPDRDHTPVMEGCKITPHELAQATKEARSLTWTEDTAKAFRDILTQLKKEGISPSDRRRAKSIDIVNAQAWLNGHSEVETEDLEILSHVLWDDHKEQPKKVAKIVASIVDPVKDLVARHSQEIEDIMANHNPSDLDLAEAQEMTTKIKEIQGKLKPYDKHKIVKDMMADNERLIVQIRLGSI